MKHFKSRLHAMLVVLLLPFATSCGRDGFDVYLCIGQSNMAGRGTLSEAVRRTRQAMKYGKLRGIVWHQGESDSERTEDYAIRLERMMGDLRDELGDVPVVVGEIARWLPYADDVNRALHEAVSLIPQSDCISSQGCGMLRDESDPHFNREGAMLLGERYAEKMLVLQGR